MYATFDTSKLPILKITFNDAEPKSVPEFQSYLDQMLQIYKENEKLVLIFDSTKTKYLSAEYRILQGNWLKTNKDLISKVAQRMIFIIPSIAINLLFKTILSIQPLPAPHIVLKTMEEAMAEANLVLGNKK